MSTITNNSCFSSAPVFQGSLKVASECTHKTRSLKLNPATIRGFFNTCTFLFLTLKKHLHTFGDIMHEAKSSVPFLLIICFYCQIVLAKITWLYKLLTHCRECSGNGFELWMTIMGLLAEVSRPLPIMSHTTLIVTFFAMTIKCY